MPEDWENMRDFADKLIKHANDHFQTGYQNMERIISERISVIHFDHALELLMKSYLLREGFIINEIDIPKIKKGIKGENKLIKELLKKNRTFIFDDVCKIFSEELNLLNAEKKAIKNFHELRNEIQHRALNFPYPKREKIEHFVPIFKIIYEKAFRERAFPIETEDSS